ncbi:UDP-glycosyltransferase 87A1-like [Senna tora]|uniref:UDP-glycosyltransferase 87A1-like n=1 Tax=Senna tora TaxID=362788 RepID=A0A834T6X6_9FABA|nr:UDP-glycosyltransferase 87A1-like [Senna tora]
MDMCGSLKGHVVAMPYPSRGHVNPMMNLCKFLASTRPHEIVITFVVTQEWLGFIGSYPKPDSIRFASIPNVIPLESQIAAVTKTRAPFEQLLDQLEPPVTAIVADVELGWPTAVANRRNIPVALLWTMSASFYCTIHHLNILSSNRRLAVHLFDEHTELIPKISSSEEVGDLRNLLHENDPRFLELLLECISQVPKTDYLLLNTIQELESAPINFLKPTFPFRLYPIGPAIPFMDSSPTNLDDPIIQNWLDSQPKMSVLYISLGSFLSVSSPQMEQLASALKTSGIRFLWVARSYAASTTGVLEPLWVEFNSRGCVRWCAYSGVSSVFGSRFELQENCGRVEEWAEGGGFVTREEILEVLRMVMDVESEEGKEIRERAREVKDMCRRGIARGGSSDINLTTFVQDILGVEGH